MVDSYTYYSCGEPGHMVKDFPNRRSQEQGKERSQLIGPSEKAQKRKRFFALKSRVQGKALLVMSRVSSLN